MDGKTIIYEVGDYDGTKGIYSTLELAQEANKRFGGNCSIEESYLDEMPPLIDGKYLWWVVLRSDKSVIRVQTREMSLSGVIVEYEGQKNSFWVYYQEPRGNEFVHLCQAVDEEEAVELARNALFPCPPNPDPVINGLELKRSDIYEDRIQELINSSYEIGKSFTKESK